MPMWAIDALLSSSPDAILKLVTDADEKIYR